MSLKKTAKPLAKGQIWKMAESRIEIVQVGKTLTHYKHFKATQHRGVRIELKAIRIVQEFLATKKARLCT